MPRRRPQAPMRQGLIPGQEIRDLKGPLAKHVVPDQILGRISCQVSTRAPRCQLRAPNLPWCPFPPIIQGCLRGGPIPPTIQGCLRGVPIPLIIQGCLRGVPDLGAQAQEIEVRTHFGTFFGS